MPGHPRGHPDIRVWHIRENLLRFERRLMYLVCLFAARSAATMRPPWSVQRATLSAEVFRLQR